MTKQSDNVRYAFLPQKDKDAARRMHETVALHLTATRLMEAFDAVVGRWVAFSLSDGRSNGDIYESKDEAIRFMSPREKDYCYLKITPDGIAPEDAWRFLRINRLPFIDNTAPEFVNNPIIYPHMSNLSAEQRRAVALMAERQARMRP